MNTRIHDTIKGRYLQERPRFIAVQNDFPHFGIYGVKGTLCLQGSNSKETNNKKMDDFLQNGNFNANLQISYEMDLTPRISTRKNTDSLGPITLL